MKDKLNERKSKVGSKVKAENLYDDMGLDESEW